MGNSHSSLNVLNTVCNAVAAVAGVSGVGVAVYALTTPRGQQMVRSILMVVVHPERSHEGGDIETGGLDSTYGGNGSVRATDRPTYVHQDLAWIATVGASPHGSPVPQYEHGPGGTAQEYTAANEIEVDIADLSRLGPPAYEAAARTPPPEYTESPEDPTESKMLIKANQDFHKSKS